VIGALITGQVVARMSQVQSRLPRATRDAAGDVAREVAARAQARANAQGSVHGHVSSGIGATSEGLTLNVIEQPAIMGAEFGGGGRPTTRQFPPFTTAGYMVYPELNDPATLEFYADLIERGL
jgi:hypothetical protein